MEKSIHGEERAWFLHVYFRVGRNPYEVCLHSSLKLRAETHFSTSIRLKSRVGVSFLLLKTGGKRNVISNRLASFQNSKKIKEIEM